MKKCYFFFLLAVVVGALHSHAGILSHTEAAPVAGKIYKDSSVHGLSIAPGLLRAVPNVFHLFTHGRSGALYLDGTWKDKFAIREWMASRIDLTGIDHINIYACEFAKGLAGADAVAYLEQSLGVTISASDDITGKSGDWELEVGAFVSVAGMIDYEGDLQCPGGVVGGTGPNDDFDGDGICNNLDIDDDNDGIPDAIESPSCFYTATEANTIVSVTSSLTSPDDNQVDGDIGILHDGSAALTFNFTAGQAINGASLFIVQYPVAVQLSQLSFVNATTFGAGVTARLEGSQDGLAWTNLGNGDVALGNTANPKAFNNTNTNKYKYYRVLGTAGNNTVASTTIGEVNSTLTADYNPSAHPKATCTADTDNDGAVDYQDRDSDGDGCSDAYEAGATTSKTANFQFPATPDANSNGLNDGIENGSTGTINYVYLPYAYNAANNLCTDTDGDGISDLLDIDDDNDGVLDITEQQQLSCEKLSRNRVVWQSLSGSTASGSITVEGNTVNVVATSTKPLNALADGPWTFGSGTYTGCPDLSTSPNTAINIFTNAYTVTFTFDKPVHNPSINFSSFNGSTVNFPHDVYVSGLQGTLSGVTIGSYITSIPATENEVSVIYNGVFNSISFTVPSADNQGRVILNISDIAATGTTPYVNTSGDPFIYLDKDTDNDGIPNRLDLDSDGDGCSDSYEAGAIATEVANHKFPVTPDANSNGLNDGVESGTSGAINYSSTYNQYATAKSLSLCADYDADGVPDIIDIDDDNDGITDAIESPDCYYTAAEVNTIVRVTSSLSSPDDNQADGDLQVLHDGSATLAFNFTAGQAINGASLFILGYPTAVQLSQISFVNATSFGAGVTARLEGSQDGLVWTDLGNGNVALSNTTNPKVFNNTNTGRYQFYRILGTAGPNTVGSTTIGEINSVLATGYNPSAYPKAVCAKDTDGDTNVDQRDLDSDGDGCSDSYEAGAITTEATNHQFPAAPDANGNGLNDAVENGTTGTTNYTMLPYAYDATKALCVDTDGDGVPDLFDIDDDNDGVLDAVESPDCFYTSAEISIPVAVSTSVATTGNVANLYDNNTATTFNFTGGTAKANLTVFEITPAYPLEATALQIAMNTSGQTAFSNTAASLTMEGWNGAAWVTLMPAFNPSAAPNTVSGLFQTFTFTQNQTTKYTKFRLQGSAGTVTANLIRDVKLLPAASYVPSANPKNTCSTDTDGDGIVNHLDLDSDGDGCTDAIEAGAAAQAGVTTLPGQVKNGSGGTVTSTVNNPMAIIAGPYGSNGFADLLQKDAPETDVYRFTYTYALATDNTQHTCCPVISNNTIGSNQAVCSSTTPATLIGSTPALNPTGATILYQWMSSTTSGTTGFTNISGATAKDYTFSGPVSQTTYYKRVAYTNGCALYNDTTAEVTITITGVSAGTLSGTQNICIGGTTAFTATDATATGMWTSDNSSVATIDPNTGAINGISAGTATISYTVPGTGGCPDAIATRTVTVTAPPTAGTLSGVQSICVGGTTTLISTQSGGSWASANPAIATVDAVSGLVSGVVAGTATITYTVAGTGGCGNATATSTVTVATPPNAGTLNGTQAICAGNTTTFTVTNNSASGSWSTSDATIATVNTNGQVTGMAAGTATITYTVAGAGGCANATATRTVTVTATPSAGTLGGTQAICVNGNTTFTATGASAVGSWSSGNTAVATVDAGTGVITGVAAGTTTITYTVTGTGGCTNATATRTITVTATPSAGTLSGTQAVCVNGNTTFIATNASAAGAWSSSDAGIAVVNATTGTITGMAAGTATITYTVPGTGGCSNATATRTVTVTAAPVAGTLSGTQAVCINATTTFVASGGSAAGTWSATDPAIATVDAATGIITGLSAGTTTITYTVAGTGGCGNATATRTVTVTAAPVAGTVNGTQAICVNGNTTFVVNGASAPGSWSSSDVAVATVDAGTGVITGVAAGTATISYTVPGAGGCADAIATRTVTVTSPAVAGTLSGVQAICSGNTTTFSSTQPGGSWTSDNTAVATVDASTGVVTGVSAGTAVITYTVTGTGGCSNAIATRTVTVTALPSAGTLSGTQQICTGATTTFISTQTGGSWTSDNTGVATVDAASGVVTGVSAGTAIITYTITGTGGCSDATATRTVTVTTPPLAGTLSGTQQICTGTTTTFSSTQAGGSWSSDNTAVATVNAGTGLITGITAGTATITYTVPGNGGCSDVTAIRSITITAPPSAGTLSGSQDICVGATTTFTNSGNSAGGTWSSSNAAVSTVDPGTGLITGVSVGTATITYLVTGTGGCSDASVTRTINVTSAPQAGTLTGQTNICLGGNTIFDPVGANGTGTWGTSDGGTASVDPVTGVVTGVAPGSATISYTVSGGVGCTSATSTVIVTVGVTAGPTAGTLSGTQDICIGNTTTFISTGASAAGVWTTSDPSIATVDAGGVVTGVAAGTASITYTVAGTGGCGDAFVIRQVHVTANPVAATLAGTQAVCVNSTTTFTATGGSAPGSWSTSDAGIATVDAATGTVTGVGAGTATITYTVAGMGGCADVTSTRTVTVTALPVAGTLGGTQNICTGNTTTYSATGASATGTFRTSNAAVATVDAASGLITGISAGTATITYTVTGTGGCGDATTTRTVTVTATPSAGTLSGIQNICAGNTTTFTAANASAAGSWSSADPAVATIDPSSGIVTGMAAGTTTITYTVTGSGGCSNATATRTITITAPPVAGTLSGVQEICIGNTTTFSATGASATGTWSSSSTSIATVDASTGIITGQSAGTAVITYTVNGTGGCGNATSSRTVTVSAPVTAGTLSGTQQVCVGGSTTFTASGQSVQGSWSSSNISIATVDATSGLITGVAVGTATITYTVAGSGGCVDATTTRTVTVTAPPVAGTISGTQSICIGDNTTFTATGASAAGSWSTSDPAVATVDVASGVISGVAAGTATITYTVAGTGGCSNVSATRTVTVTAPVLAGTITGTQEICVSGNTTFVATGASAAGTWSTSDASIATINTTTGVITGVSAGTATITFTVPGSGGCADATSTRNVIVTAAAVAGTVSGIQEICISNTTTFTVTGASAPGAWSSSNNAVASIDPASGIITGIAAGTATITYTVAGTGGCSDAIATRSVTVTAPPVAGTLGGNEQICIGSTSVFTATGASAAGVWSSSDAAIATVDATSGIVTGIAAGTATITYTVNGTGGCGNASATRTVTVTAPVTAGTLGGTQAICKNGTTTFTVSGNSTPGNWSTSDAAIATIDPVSGVITGGAAGTATITYTVMGTGGCNNATATRTVNVTAPAVAGTLAGTQAICVGGTTTFTATGASTSGSWTSGNTAVATIDPASGVITGLTAGTATMTFTVTGTGGCSNAVATRTITVTAPATAGVISGTQNICVGSTTTFTATGESATGSWSSSNAAIATINPATGVITALSAGTATITYLVPGAGGCGDATATRTITVAAPAVAGTINGVQAVCINGTTTFTASGASGTGSWTTSDPAIATVNANTGLITGVAAGTATITYTVTGTGGCTNATATRTVTVTAPPVAGTLTGTQEICVGNTSSLSVTGASASGTWSSDNTAIATVNNSGAVTGISAGIVVISYTVPGSGGCSNVSTAMIITVTAPPVSGTVTGTQEVIVNESTLYSVTGESAAGTWTSDNTAIVTVDPSTGLVTGVAPGTANILYTVPGTGGCGDAIATRTVTVIAINGAMILEKTAVFNDTDADGNAEAGETITYSFKVTNTGNVTLTNITITDPLVTVTGTLATLAPGAEDNTTFTAVYTIKQSDVDAGKVTNQATARGTDPSNTPVTVTSDDPATTTPGDGTVIILTPNSAMSLEKTATFIDSDGDGVAEAGESIRYSFKVKNTGSVTLANITITDPLVPVTGTLATLAPGAEDNTTFTAVYTIKQSDVDAGRVTNQATAHGTDPSNTPVTVTSDDPATTTPGDGTVITLPPLVEVFTDLMVTKNVNNPAPTVGSNVTFTIVASNLGPGNATGVVVNDPLPNGYTLVSISASGTTTYNNGVWTIGNLANGGSALLNIVATVNATGTYANTATISSTTTDRTRANNVAAVTPVPVQNKPVAQDDNLTTNLNTPVIIRIIENDSPGNSTFDLASVEIITLPKHGTLKVNGDGTITYVPDANYTGDDSFTYRLRDTHGNYTNVASVNILSVVGDLKIPNLFTPNGDGTNDKFEIIGLNQYSQSNLVIVNRWGNEVYHATNYQNNWTGEGLNEGTYYYLLKVRKSDNSDWIVYKGWLTLIRNFKR